MRRIVLAMFFGVCCASAGSAAAATESCGTPLLGQDGWSIEQNPLHGGFNPDLLCDAMRTFVGSPRNRHGLVVERHGKLVVDAYRAGPDRSTYAVWASRTKFDKDQLHDVRSITKSVVAMLWGITESGRVAPPLTTPVLDLLPGLNDLRSGGRERITVADMLCMRSGLAWDETGGYGRWTNDEKGLLWRGDRARYVFERPLAAPPGALFNYNGGLSTVLGQLLEEQTGSSLKAYAGQWLFRPLGITEWEWVGDLRGRTRAFTGLRLRPRDLARLGRLMLQGGEWEGRQVVPQAWVQTLLSPCAADGEEFGHHWWSGNVFVRGKEVRWHAAFGNGGQRLFIVPSLDLVVVMTAGEYDDGSVGRAQRHLLQQVVAATLEHAGEPAPSAAPSAPVAQVVAPVETRATFRSVAEEDGGARTYVRLKVVPSVNLPFTTLRLRVRDPAILAGLREGATVKFQAERIDGENSLTAIRAVPPCVRFQPCD